MLGIIIVIVLLLIAYRSGIIGYTGEKMSNGYNWMNNCSWTGLLSSNDIDEIKNATINKNPYMDYTYTYWNGVQRLSCDECPNAYACKECPQMKVLPGYYTDQNRIRGIYNEIDVGVDEKAPLVNSEYFIGDDPQPANGKDTPNTYDVTRDDQREHTIMPSHDLDSEYKTSRDHMGAVRNKGPHLHGGNLTSMVGETTDELGADEKFKQLRMLGCKKSKPCNYSGTCSGSPAMKLLYTDIMGLQNPLPDRGDCEYLRYNGYLYKEPCEFNEYTTN